MKPAFWKLSHGSDLFTFPKLLKSIEDKLVYVHKNTGKKGKSTTAQGTDFVTAAIGDYFYLTYGNNGVYLLGQFTGPANVFSTFGDGWLDRPYRVIARSKTHEFYQGQEKWWSPNHNSTFVKVPDDEIKLFEELILVPYFDIKLKKYGF
jgi:hypothetical protein